MKKSEDLTDDQSDRFEELKNVVGSTVEEHEGTDELFNSRHPENGMFHQKKGKNSPFSQDIPANLLDGPSIH